MHIFLCQEIIFIFYIDLIRTARLKANNSFSCFVRWLEYRKVVIRPEAVLDSGCTMPDVFGIHSGLIADPASSLPGHSSKERRPVSIP